MSDDGATEALFDAAEGLCAAVIGVVAHPVLLVLGSVFSEGVMLLLALFANLETCCAALLCLLSVLLLPGLVGMRLDGLR